MLAESSPIPTIKRSLDRFLGDEKGEIDRQSIIKIGTALGVASLITSLLSDIVLAHSSYWGHWSWSNTPTVMDVFASRS